MPTARHTRDIDLLAQATSDLNAAADALRELAQLDLGDYFRFVVTSTSESPVQDQPGVDKLQLTVDAYCGARSTGRFKIDLVVGSVMTAEPDRVAPSNRIVLPGLATSTEYRVYPVVDHVADKVCATVELHNGRPSSRARDLVDIVVVARTQVVAAAALGFAIEQERLHRGLAPIAAYSAPASWRTVYAREAKGALEIDGHRTFEEAVPLARRFLDPLLDGSRLTGNWSPGKHSWFD